MKWNEAASVLKKKTSGLSQALRNAAWTLKWWVLGRAIRLPKRTSSAREYCQKHGLVWKGVYPAATREWGPARQLGRVTVDFPKLRDGNFPERGVAVIPGGSVVGRNGWIVAPGGILIDDQYEVPALDRCPDDRKWHKKFRLKGVSCSLAVHWGANYGHFMTECLPKVEVLHKAGYAVEEVDHFICPKPNIELGRDFLEAVGIPREKIVWVEHGKAYESETLLVVNHPGVHATFTRETHQFLRRHFGVEVKKPWRRLYVGRKGYRTIQNEAELKPLLEEFGFETYVWNGELRQQHQVFAESTIVVGVHGSTLVNVAFCAPGTRFLNLLTDSLIDPFFYCLADSCGIEFSYLVGRSLSSSESGGFDGMAPNYNVNPGEFRAALEQLCG